jgi:hypothetical protein
MLGSGCWRAALPLLKVGLIFLGEVFDRGGDRADRAVSEGAERTAQDVVGQVEQCLDVFRGCMTLFQAFINGDVPVGALTAGRAFSAGFVGVELAPLLDRPDHAVTLVEDHQRGRAVHGTRFRDGVKVERNIEVVLGEQRGG